MDWQDKFSTIVRETELNLAKAKKKLSSKAHSPLSNSCQETSKSQIKNLPNSTTGSSYRPVKSVNFDFDIDGRKLNSSFDFDNMSATSIQVFHMQEQINSQNRTIDKLKHIVKSLDGERDYYKEQISVLKGEVDLLTNTMKHQPSAIASDLKMSNVKRELMQEMEKVKSLVQRFGKDSSRQTPVLSPRFDPEFWNIKENLTSSLQQVRYELIQMKGRIDRMEGQIAIDNLNKSKQESNTTDSFHKSLHHPIDPILTKPLYTPTTKVSPSVTPTDLNQLRMAISNMNSKIDNIERKSSLECKVFDEGNLRPSVTVPSPRRNPFLSSLSRPFDSIVPHEDLHSLSDPSDVSGISLSDDNSDDDDDDDLDDLLGLNLLHDKYGVAKDTASSGVKDSYIKKGRVEFDLSDLDLSDIEEVDGVDFDNESLDLDL